MQHAGLSDIASYLEGFLDPVLDERKLGVILWVSEQVKREPKIFLYIPCGTGVRQSTSDYHYVLHSSLNYV